MFAFLVAEEVDVVTESPRRWHSQASNKLEKQERLCIYGFKIELLVYTV